eukprot:3777991-Amphidinium_carterae.1
MLMQTCIIQRDWSLSASNAGTTEKCVRALAPMSCIASSRNSGLPQAGLCIKPLRHIVSGYA